MRDSLINKKHTHGGRGGGETVIFTQGFHATFRAHAFVPPPRKGVGGWVMERSDAAAGRPPHPALPRMREAKTKE